MDSFEQDISRFVGKLNAIKQIEVPRAISKSLNTVASRSKRRIANAVSAQTKIPKKHINKKTYIGRSTAKTLAAKIVIYRNDVSLASLLSKKNVATRLAKSKRKRRTKIRWKGNVYGAAFVAKTKSRGVTQVFRRKSARRYPLDAVKVPIKKNVDSVAPVIAKRVMKSDFRKALAGDLNGRLKKYEQK